MSFWSRWLKNQAPVVSQPVVEQQVTVTATNKPVQSRSQDVTDSARLSPVLSLDEQGNPSLLPMNWPESDDVLVAQSWFQGWSRSRPVAEQWLLDQQQRDARKLERWSSHVITLAVSNDMRQRLLDVIVDTELLKPLLIVFKHKDKSVYKRVRKLLNLDMVVDNSKTVIQSDVQTVRVSVLPVASSEAMPPADQIDADKKNYADGSLLCKQTLNLYQALSGFSVSHLSSLQTLLAQQQPLHQKALLTAELSVGSSPEQLCFIKDYERVQQLSEALERWLACEEELEQLCQQQTAPLALTPMELQIKRLQALLNQLNWPLAGDSLLLLRQAKQQLKQLLLQLAAVQQQLDHARSTWELQFPLLEQHLQVGEWQKAESVIKRLQELVLKPKQKKQLQGVAKRIDELKDWQVFAELPKKQQLLAAMQQLVDAPLPVEQQSRRVKQLQTQWQQLNISEHHALWQQFKNLAELAYQPCKQFYAQQKQQRLENAKTRELLCAQLEQYIAEIDWSKADLTKVGQTQQLAKRAWRAAFPVERHLANELQPRFDAAMQKIQAKQDEFLRQQALKRQQIQQLRQEKAAKRKLQLEAEEKRKQQELDRQAKIRAQQLAQEQLRQQLDDQYLAQLLQHGGGEETSADDDLKKNTLVIRLEILAGLPSPEDEQALRMQVQVERLAKNFKASESKLAAHHECVSQWCAGLRLTDSAAHQSLLARMRLAYQQYAASHR